MRMSESAEPRIARLSQLTIEKHQRPRSGGRTWMVLAAIVLALGGGAGAAVWYYYQTSGKSIAAAFATRPIDVTLVRIAAPERDVSAAMLVATGRIVSDVQVNVATKVSGQIVELFVEQGDRVEKDQVLARVEDVTYRAQRDEAAANLSRLGSMIERARAEVARAEAAVLQAQADLEFEQRNYERLARLGQTNQASEFEVLSARSRADSARAAVEVAKAAVETSRAAALAAESDRAAAEAVLRIWQKRLDDCAIRAPISGVILERNAQVGDFVAAEGGRGANANAQLVRIADMQRLRVEVDISERDVGRLTAGQRARISPDAARNSTYDGYIMWIDPLSDYAKAQVQVKVRIENPGPDLRIEGSAKVEFLTAPVSTPASGPAPIWLPKAALRLTPGSDDAIVFTVENSKAKARTVKVGTRSDRTVEIIRGLTAGMEIIADVSDKLEDGSAVRVSRTVNASEL